jgi:hypothetical protein
MKQIKRTVELPGDDWIVSNAWNLPTNLIEFRSAIGSFGSLASERKVREFLKTPAAKPMPKELRKEVDKWIGSSKK